MVGRTGSPPSLGYSSAGVLNKRWLYLTVASPALILETFPYASIKVDVCLVLVVFYLFSVLSLHAALSRYSESKGVCARLRAIFPQHRFDRPAHSPEASASVWMYALLQAFMCIGKLARHHPQLPKLAPGIAQRSMQHDCHKFEPNRTARPSSEIRSLITSRTFEAPVHGLIVSSTPSNPKPGPPSCNLETLH